MEKCLGRGFIQDFTLLGVGYSSRRGPLPFPPLLSSPLPFLSFLPLLCLLGERISSPSGVRGRALASNAFRLRLQPRKRIQWLQNANGVRLQLNNVEIDVHECFDHVLYLCFSNRSDEIKLHYPRCHVPC